MTENRKNAILILFILLISESYIVPIATIFNQPIFNLYRIRWYLFWYSKFRELSSKCATAVTFFGGMNISSWERTSLKTILQIWCIFFQKIYILVIVIRNSFNIDLYFTVKYFKFLQYLCSNPQQLAFAWDCY